MSQKIEVRITQGQASHSTSLKARATKLDTTTSDTVVRIQLVKGTGADTIFTELALGKPEQCTFWIGSIGYRWLRTVDGKELIYDLESLSVNRAKRHTAS